MNTFNGAPLTPPDVAREVSPAAVAAWLAGWTAFAAFEVWLWRRKGVTVCRVAKHLARLEHADPRMQHRGKVAFTAVYAAGSLGLYAHVIGRKQR